MQLSDVDLNDLDAWEKATPHEQFRVLRRESPIYLPPERAGASWSGVL